MKKSISIGTRTLKLKYKQSRHPRFKNQNQRRKFTSRFQRKVKDFYDLNEMLEEEEGYNQDNIDNQPQDLNQSNKLEQPLMPVEIENHITQTHTTQIFSDGQKEYKVNIPPTLLHTTHKEPIKFYQKAIVQFDINNETIYHSILNHSIN